MISLHSYQEPDRKVFLSEKFVNKYMGEVLKNEGVEYDAGTGAGETVDIAVPVVSFPVLHCLERIHTAIERIEAAHPRYTHYPILYRGTDESKAIGPSTREDGLFRDVLHNLSVVECMGLAVLGDFFTSDWLVDLATTMLVRKINLSKKTNKSLLLPDIVFLVEKTEMDVFFDDHLEKDHPWMFL
jgi:hypothetical protein